MARYRVTIAGTFKEDGTPHVEPPRQPCCKEKGVDGAEVWGRPLWAELHAAESLPSDFAQRIPCPECQAHFLSYVAAHPPPVGAFHQYTVDLHNEINARLGKPIWP